MFSMDPIRIISARVRCIHGWLSAVIASVSLAGTAIGAGGRTAGPGASAPAASDISYSIRETAGVHVKEVDGHRRLQGRDQFKVMLVPAEGDEWDMTHVSILGLMLKNTGKTEIIFDLMLGNAGATGWSNSALGRAIVKPGEAMPLAVAICRSADYRRADPAYLRMSGKPDGSFRHWHTFDPGRVRNLVMTCTSDGESAFELGRMYPLREMDDRLMGTFPFIDEYGQYIHRSWPDKVRSDEQLRKSAELDEKLEKRLAASSPFNRYGGWNEGPRFEATGYFHTAKHGGRWWFVDPEGCLFWSFGVNCAGVEYAGQTPTGRDLSVFTDLPEQEDEEFGRFHTLIDVEDNYRLLEDVPHYDFTRANLYRKYGKGWENIWVDRDLARLKYCGLNTIGAWSDTTVAECREIPYTVMLHYEYAFAAEKLPDPFHPETRAGLRKAIQEYPIPFKNDPWCLGAFVNNELHWKNNEVNMVAAILGYEEADTEAKKVFRDWLKKKYGDLDSMNAAWKTRFRGWDDLMKGAGDSTFRHADAADCSALTVLFAEAYFAMVKQELERYAPNLLYLGCRFNTAPAEVIRTAAEYADVISVNMYAYRPNPGNYGSAGKPVLISEFHFANLTGNNLGSGLRSASDAVQQGRLFRAFMKDAVDHPQIIGAHWYQWRDQNVGGRYDGENFDVGFFDVADIPNTELIRAAAEQGRTLYMNLD